MAVENLQTHGLAVVTRQGLREPLLLGGGPDKFYTRINGKPNQSGLVTQQGAMVGQLAREALEVDLVQDLEPGWVAGGGIVGWGCGSRLG